MKELINVYTFNTPQDVDDFLSLSAWREEYGIKCILSGGKSMLLFYVRYYGRYVLPDKDDKVKYLGNGEWEIKYEN